MEAEQKCNEMRRVSLFKGNIEMEKCADINECIISARNSDEEAFSVIFHNYLPLIRKILSSFSSSLDEAEREDASQEALIALYQAVQSYQVDGKVAFGVYAGVCIKNRMISELRNLKKQCPSCVTVSDFTVGESGDSFNTAESPEQSFIDQEAFHTFFHTVMANFTSLEKRVFLLYVDGCSYKEIAKCLHISEKSVDNAIIRLKAKLKKLTLL